MDAKYHNIIDGWESRIALNLVGFLVWLTASIALMVATS